MPDDDIDLLYAEIRRLFGIAGTTPTDASPFLGDWTYRHYWRHDPGATEPSGHHSFAADGAAPNRARDGSFDNPHDRWSFNEDGTLSLWLHTGTMPEYGIDQPTYSEDRFHVLLTGPDDFVLFNGDGSVILLYRRAA